jgi:SAM-dependent methyltransferase
VERAELEWTIQGQVIHASRLGSRLAVLSHLSEGTKPHGVLSSVWDFEAWDNYNERKVVRHLLKKVKTTEHAFVLDVGAGDLVIASQVSASSRQVIAIDLNRPPLQVGLPEAVEFLLADARFLPFRNGIFSLTYERDMLHHLQNKSDMRRAIKEMIRVTLQEGRVKLLEANRYNLYPMLVMYVKKAEGHNHLPAKALRELTGQSGEFYGFDLLPPTSIGTKNPVILVTGLGLAYIRLSCRLSPALFALMTLLNGLREEYLRILPMYNLCSLSPSELKMKTA